MAQSLFDKYGGFATVSAVVHNFYDKIVASKTLGAYFDGVDMEKLIDHQTKFMCMALGGPNSYDGRSLEKAHRHLKITQAAFNEVAGYLSDALTEGGMEKADVDAVIALVASHAPQVITA